ncbi:MAG TPA: FtsX-like permease family protein [Lachnospiraceae bacterium]|nr:FtsX-like permease family protein [Lachnospiraceae bacterium]
MMLRREFLRSVAETRTRFISILLIVMLGVAFFSGVRASGPDMKLSADAYYDAQNLQDIRILSTLGLTEDDISAIRAVKGVKEVEPGYSCDVFAESEESQLILRFMSLPKSISCVTVESGRLPQTDGECAVDTNFAKKSGWEIGDSFKITAPKDKELSDELSTDTYTIVGTCSTPLFLSLERGSSTIGSGNLNSYVYVPSSSFTMDVYTQATITAEGAQELLCYSDAYDDLISDEEDEIGKIDDSRCNIRFAEVKADGQAKIDDARKQIEDAKAELSDAKKKLEDARQKISDAKTEIADKEKELADGEQKIEDSQKELDDGRKKLEDGYESYNSAVTELNSKIDTLNDGNAALQDAVNQYNDGEMQYAAGLSEYQAGLDAFNSQNGDANITALEAGLTDADSGLAQVQDGLASAKTAYEAAKAAGADAEVLKGAEAKITELTAKEETLKAQISTMETQLAALKEAKSKLESAKATLDETRASLDAASAEIDEKKAEISDAQAQIEAAKEQLKESLDTLDANKEKLESGQAELDEAKQKAEDGRKQLDDAEEELAGHEKELEDAQAEYDSKAADAEDKIAENESKVDDAQKDLDDLEKPTWYVLNRKTLTSYVEYGQNTDRIVAIGNVFPVIFFLVAALICLTTMTRMVEENRTQIGTLKALGYKGRTIAAKYIFYALLATVIGSIAGFIAGENILPYFIITAYKILYDNLPEILTPLHMSLSLSATAAAIGTTTIAAAVACLSEARAVPADLMRPAAPPSGKRIFLEKMGFLWKRLNFSNKATFRNLFRYKKRFFMTVLGIGGCMGILLTGFGLKDSIMAIGTIQFGKIDFHDADVMYDDGIDDEAKKAIFDNVRSDTDTEKSVQAMTVSMDVQAEDSDTKRSAYILSPSDTEGFSEFVSMHSRLKNEQYSLSDDGVVLTEKIASLMNVKAGDSFYIYKSDTEKYEVKVSAVMENYFFHYVYMSPVYYQKVFGEGPEYNEVMVKLKDVSTEAEDSFRSRMTQSGDVSGVNFTTSMAERIANMLHSMDAIIYVIVIAAGALAFIVLYNLNNINVEERKRELATLKVLGFFNGEISQYVLRENIWLTLIGCLAGILIGIPLHYFVIKTAEIEIMMFGRNIEPASFLISIGLTFIFSTIVNVVMHFSLKKIDMVESLKSIE